MAESSDVPGSPQFDTTPAEFAPTSVYDPVLEQPGPGRLVLRPHAWVPSSLRDPAYDPKSGEQAVKEILPKPLSYLSVVFRRWPSTQIFLPVLIILVLFCSPWEPGKGWPTTPGEAWSAMPGVGKVLFMIAVPCALIAAFLQTWISFRRAMHAYVCWDCRRGMMTLGRWRFRQSRPLGDILSVQVLQVCPPSTIFPDEKQRPYYQVNLALTDPHGARLNLTNHVDLKWSRWAGGRLAEFLGVPLTEHAEGETPAPSAATIQVGKRTFKLDPTLTEKLHYTAQPTLRVGGQRLVIASASFWERGTTDQPGGPIGATQTKLWANVWYRSFLRACLLVGLLWPPVLIGLMTWLGTRVVREWAGAGAWFEMVLVPVVALVATYLLLRNRFRQTFRGDSVTFDRETGWVGYLVGSERRKILLSEVVAVQVLGESRSTLKDYPWSPPVGVVEWIYQVNLIRDDQGEPRSHLLNESDPTRARQIGKQVADFLGVPLVDQIPAGHARGD